MKRLGIGIALLLTIALAGWLWGSPYLTLWQLKKAADARDIATLSAHVDYPAVRESLRRQLHAELRGPVDDGSDPLASLGRAVARRLADPIVDAAVTPEGLQALFSSTQGAQASAPPALGVRAEDMVVRRETLGRFRLQQPDGKGPLLIFQLQGTRWALVDIRVPRAMLHL